VRDSAGVTIVENSGAVPADGGGWSLSPEPLVSIGTFQGDSLYQLYSVQGATRLSDGRIAVVNGGSGQVRFYDSAGVYLASIGRKGEGPGEFDGPALAGVLPGDTLLVVDGNLRRISLLHPDGGVVRTAPISDDLGGNLYPRGMFGDGSVVLGGGFYWSSDSGDQLSDGYRRPPTAYRSCALDGALVTDFGEFPGSEFFMQVRTVGGGVSMAARLIPFGKYAMAAVSPDRLLFGSGDSYEILAYDPSGRLLEVFRRDREPVPVAGSDLDAYIEERAADAEDENAARETRQSFADMPVPDFMPAFAGLESDAFGYLWAEAYRRPGEEGASFDIFDPQGALVGKVVLPEWVEILEIGRDYVLGLFRDELDVEYVRLYRLQRPRL
jgi:hypothetical protein